MTPLAVNRCPLRAWRVGHDAIEHVDAAQHRGHDVLRAPDAHEIARRLAGMCGMRVSRIREPLRLRFPDREAADRESRPVEAQQGLEGGEAQVRVHAALHDAEQPAGRIGGGA